jgi:hypothetical protein
MKTHTKKWIYLSLCLNVLFLADLGAQPKSAKGFSKPVSLLEQMRNSFPNAKAVFTSKKKVITIGLDKKDSVSVIAENWFEMLHLRHRSDQFATESVPFSRFNQILSINAYTMVNENGKVRAIKAQDFVTGSVVSKNWFYDDYKEKTFLFPSIEPGATTVLHYKEAIREPRFLGVFYLNSYVPVKKSEYILQVHKDIKINFKVYGAENLKIDFTKKRLGEQTIYSWKANNLAEYKSEKDAPNISYYEPHIIVYITHIKEKSLLTNHAGLYKWYYEMVKDVNKHILPEIKTLVDTLTKNDKTDSTKAKTIFHWVQSNIKYIAIEDGLSGFIPRSANEVYRNRYGDCKDMTSMIVTMLKMANIPAYLTWIGTRKLPYSYNDVPTPMVDNHMIATAKIDGNNFFLDATDSYVPFGMPTAMIQGKEAMIGIDSLNYEITPVPVMKSEQNVTIDTCWIDLDNEDISGKGHILLKGYYKSNSSFEVVEQKDKEQKDNFLKLLGWEEKLNPTIHALSFHEVENDDQQLTIQYDFRIGEHCRTTKEELFLNLHLDRRLQHESIQADKRKTDREIEYQFNDLRCVVVNLPQNYKVDFIPPNSSFQTAKFGFNIEYEVIGQQLLMKKNIYCNYLFLNSTEFYAWNEMIKKLDLAYRSSVKLLKLN